MQKYLPYFLLALPFFILKITNLGVWLSDANIYFYTGYQLLQGKILYKDIFFTNFPLLPYVSALYFFLTQGNLPMFFFTATLEVLATGFLIYCIVYQQTKKIFLAVLSSALYIYSFTILSTSDHQTGVFLASLFAVLAYYFLQKRKLFFSGIFIALSLLTKAYFLPVFLAFFLLLLLRDRKSLVFFLAGCGIAASMVLLPSLLLAPNDLWRDVVSYSLTRAQGINKLNILRFFATHDIIFVLLIFWNLLIFRKQFFFGFVTLFGIIFIFLYQDIYYLYLNFLVPFLCLSFPHLFLILQNKLKFQTMVIPTAMLLVFFVNILLYIASYRDLQKIQNLSALVASIQKEKPRVLYGINSLTPALAYLTNTHLLSGIIDTNENIYRKGFLDKSTLTKKAIADKAVIVTTGVSYPEFQVEEQITGGIFDETLVKKSCRLLLSQSIRTEGIDNRINLFSCTLN